MAKSDVAQALTQSGKAAADTSLFTLFSNAKWMDLFNASPWHFILMPFIAVTFIINALIENYKLLTAPNKNFDKTFSALAASLSGAIGVASITGTVIMEMMGLTFAAGPWLFLGALSVGILHQTAMLGINAFRAFQAPAGSATRKGFMQAVVGNLFTLALLATVVATVSLVMISPAGPAVMAGVSLAAASLSLVSLGWIGLKLFAPNVAKRIKSLFGLAKPDDRIQVKQTPANSHEFELTSQPKIQVVDEENAALVNEHGVQGSFFKPLDHAHAVRTRLEHGGVQEARVYLLNQLETKVKTYSGEEQKSIDKKSVLEHLNQALSNSGHLMMSKKDLRTEHPRAFQSFFAHTGDTEKLYDAVRLFLEASQQASLEETRNKAM